MDSDDDLLELAGVSSGEEDYVPTSAAGTKRKLEDSDEEDAAGEDDDDDDNDPYPLESKYKDEADKAALMKMDEIAREEILYDRMQERQKYRERKFLALRAKQSQVEKRTSAKSVRANKLSELKRQRQKKSKKSAGEYYSDQEEDDIEEEEAYSDDDADLEELAGYGSSSRYEDRYDESSYKIASYEELLKIRSSRDNLNKFLYRDEFDEIMPGTLVRLSVGKKTYRIARIESVKRGGKIYQFFGKPCNTYLELSQAQSTHVVEMSFISDSPFTKEEFSIYESKLAEYQMKLPTVREVKDKLEELKNMAQRKLTDEDINKIVEKKRSLAVTIEDSAHRVRLVTKYREELQVALEQGNAEEVARLRAELDKLTEISQKNSQISASKLAEINLRNQKSNQEYIRKAEQKNAELRRKQIMNNDFSDPFSRLRTNPKLFYSSQVKQDADQAEEDDKKDEENKKELFQKSLFRNEGVNAVIKGLQMDLGIEL